jgi:hypothetical protein
VLSCAARFSRLPVAQNRRGLSQEGSHILSLTMVGASAHTRADRPLRRPRRRNSLSSAATIMTVRAWFIFPACPAMTHSDQNRTREAVARLAGPDPVRYRDLTQPLQAARRPGV